MKCVDGDDAAAAVDQRAARLPCEIAAVGDHKRQAVGAGLQ